MKIHLKSIGALLMIVAIVSALSEPKVLAADRPAIPPPNSDKVHFLSPQSMAQFAPGDTIKIRLQFDPALNVTDASAYVQGMGGVQGRVAPTGYEGEYRIPDYCAGTLVIDVAVYAGSTAWVFHEDRTVAVRPRQKPMSVKISQNVRMLDPRSKYPEQIYVKGTYRANPLIPPASFERDITKGAAGTRYLTSDPAVVSADGDGACRVHGPGTAVITAENDGVKDQAVFLVEDAAHPLAATELNNRVTVIKSPFRRQRGTIGFWTQEMLYVQDVRITNKSGLLLVGPLYLLIKDLPDKKVRVINSGQATVVSPVGCPYMSIKLAGDGLTLKPGESTVVTLEIDAPSASAIRYTPVLIRKSGRI
jgi:hypothetical protein